MMNPEMMKMASDMVSKMTPEQLAEMQRMAANMSPDMMQRAMAQMGSATPDQLAQMQRMTAGMSGDQLASQAAASMGAASAAGQQQADSAAAALKTEGNRLHGLGQYEQAADKYRQALDSLQGQSSPQARQLRVSCHSNLASCHLQLQRWQECVDACGAVLAADPSNRKALYRRGQALCALGRYEGAVGDLRAAVRLSPESEKELIGEKLAEAKQKLRQATQGVVIEEVTEPAAAPAAGSEEGLAECDGDEGTAPVEPAAGAAPRGGSGATAASQPFVPPGMDTDRMRQSAAMLQSNPDMARQAAEAMAGMSDEQIAALAAQSGMPGLTPEMAKQAAAMMRTLPADQLSAIASQAGAAGAMPRVPPPAAAAALATSVAGGAADAAGAAASGGVDQMAAAAEAMKRNPAMMKQAAAMMEAMSEEQLRGMASMMPGGAPVDPAQMKMAAKMMAGMSPEDMDRMTRMASSMGVAPPGGAVPAAATAGAASASPAAASGGAAPGLDPAALPADMIGNLRQRMQDPEMLRMMRSMMKGMDPAQLSEMMRASGMSVTPEQAAKMVDQLDKVSDKQLELIARLMSYVNAVLNAYRRARDWVFSQGALALAVAVLLVALLLRWLGWV